MTDPKEKPLFEADDDSPAVDGMLRELSHEPEGGNEELTARIMAAIEEVDEELHPPVTIIPMRYVWTAAAAIIICVLGVLALLHTPAIAHLDTGTVTVTRNSATTSLHAGDKLIAGDQIVASADSTIRMTDDSVVTLAGGTVLTVDTPEPGYRVRLVLTSGRMLCRVSKRPGRFVIDAGLPIEVLGTTFGVSRTSEYTRTAVYEGRVKVGDGAGTILLRSHVAQFSPHVPSPMGVDVDANDELAWARPEISFSNDDLRTVTRWLAENSRFKFEVPAERLNTRVAFSYSKKDDLVTAIQLMATSVDLTCRFDGDICVIGKE